LNGSTLTEGFALNQFALSSFVNNLSPQGFCRTKLRYTNLQQQYLPEIQMHDRQKALYLARLSRAVDEEFDMQHVPVPSARVEAEQPVHQSDRARLTEPLRLRAAELTFIEERDARHAELRATFNQLRGTQQSVAGIELLVAAAESILIENAGQGYETDLDTLVFTLRSKGYAHRALRLICKYFLTYELLSTATVDQGIRAAGLATVQKYVRLVLAGEAERAAALTSDELTSDELAGEVAA